MAQRHTPRYLRVALSGPFQHYFDYLPPQGQSITSCPAGSRVLVPFGRTHKIGIIIAHTQNTRVSAQKIRYAEQLLDATPLLTTADLDYLHWVANYYQHPTGNVILAALPARLRKRQQALALTDTFCRLAVDIATAQAAVNHAPRQQTIIQLLAQASPAGVALTTLRTQHAATPHILRALQKKGLIQLSTAQPTKTQPTPRTAAYALNAEQQTAIHTIGAQLGQFAVFLLAGVTGSGKTEVYLQLAQQVLQQNHSVLLLVPEIALTPQLQQRFIERFANGVAVLHSGLPANLRERTWHAVRQGLTPFVLGTRSAVLYPIPHLGLIIVDEEHEPSYKQQDGLRYSARDMAIVRAQRADCPVLLGTATPALESLYNVQRKRYTLLNLSRRAGTAVAPRMHILDIRDQPLQAGISNPLLVALQETIAAEEQAILFINRRGYAPVLTCYSCGWVSECTACDANQTVHRTAAQLRCHHCGACQTLPQHCPACGQLNLHPLGQGTEKVGEYLHAQFPDIPLLRLDRDTTAQPGHLEQTLSQLQTTKAALLVGTQMLAKGHHFPRVTLVGILDADGGLYSTDFRGSERMAQLLLQVAGRAGRGDRPGRVLLQSRQPDHPLLQTLIRDGYSAFAQAALAERQAAGYPPYTHHILLHAEAKQPEPPEHYLHQAATWIQQQSTNVTCWGPVPAPMARRSGKYRVQLLLQAPQRPTLHQLATALRHHLEQTTPPHGVRWSLDVDPM